MSKANRVVAIVVLLVVAVAALACAAEVIGAKIGAKIGGKIGAKVVSEVVRAHRFELYDEHGNCRVVLGLADDEVGLALSDAVGSDRAVLRVRPDGTAELVLIEESNPLIPKAVPVIPPPAPKRWTPR